MLTITRPFPRRCQRQSRSRASGPPSSSRRSPGSLRPAGEDDHHLLITLVTFQHGEPLGAAIGARRLRPRDAVNERRERAVALDGVRDPVEAHLRAIGRYTWKPRDLLAVRGAVVAHVRQPALWTLEPAGDDGRQGVVAEPGLGVRVPGAAAFEVRFRQSGHAGELSFELGVAPGRDLDRQVAIIGARRGIGRAGGDRGLRLAESVAARRRRHVAAVVRGVIPAPPGRATAAAASIREIHRIAVRFVIVRSSRPRHAVEPHAA